MMKVQIVLTVFIVNFSSLSAQPIEIQQKFQNLFDSIAKNDKKKSDNYWADLKEDLTHEQQVFNSMKDELQLTQLSYRWRNGGHFFNQRGNDTEIVKRYIHDANNENNNNSFIQNEPTLLKTCMSSEGFEGKELGELSHSDLVLVMDCMNREHTECQRVRSIQHILARNKHATMGRDQPTGAANISAPPTKFGSVFTDHMLRMEYDKSRGGWQYPQITAFGNLELHPAAKVLHYATSLFEGLKAYRGADGKIRLFRPLLNLQRLNQSAQRASLPKVDTHLLLKSIEKLINLDEEFVPYATDSSLYIRPTLIGTDPEIGLAESSNAMLYVILSPCGQYFSSGFQPVRLYADNNYTRAWPGGSGEYKMSANYAPTIFVQNKAKEFDCQQVLWLYGDDEQLTEVGCMSLFVFCINEAGERELITPPLENGLILPSITRKSILELARDWNEFKVSEKNITMSDIFRLTKEKRLLEMFGAGTACVVNPIGEIYYKRSDSLISVPTNEQNSPLYARFFKALTDIQYGRIQHPWAVEVTRDDSEVERKTASILYQ